MKKTLLISLFALFCQLMAAQRIDISVTLASDGSASVREVWDVSAERGTELYLVRTNLGEIQISNLRVWDETGTEFINEGKWDTERNLAQKAGKCGTVRRSDGVELCWGLGSYGHHRFTVDYHMANVVMAMDDYDAFHLQLVSPGVQPRPQEVSVRISSDSWELNEENTGIWAFGYEGSINFENGKIVAHTDRPFTSDAFSVIVLARFNKGMFTPQVRSSGSFQSKLDKAFKGSTYEDYLENEKQEKRMANIMAIVTILSLGLAVWGVKKSVQKRNLNMFGLERIKDIGYERDLPFNGNLLATRFILSKCGKQGSDSAIASALILKMLKDGQLMMTKDEKDKTLIAFNEKGDLSKLSDTALQFYNMMKEASGSDLILQDREFSRWSKRNQKRINTWVLSLPSGGESAIRSAGYLKGSIYSPEGQLNARRAIGFKNFLNDFTLIDERSSTEVTLWQDYIIFGALYGIADKVAKELKDINPQLFEEAVGYDYPTMHRMIFLSNNMSTSIMNAVVHEQTASSTAGHGGFSSFGGGGGFHGGGFGGGVR